MPATESTWRDSQLLHRIFAVTGVLLTICTIWMFQADYSRRWKGYQADVVNVDLKMNTWRQEQFATEEAVREHEKLASVVQLATSQPIDETLLAAFKAECEKAAAATADEYHNSPVDFTYIDADAARLKAEAQTAADKRKAANEVIAAAEKAPDDANLASQASKADREANEAETTASDIRKRLLGRLNDVVLDAKSVELRVLQQRKFTSANLDAARANLDIAVRDNLNEQARADVQKNIDERKTRLDTLNLNYQSLSAHRKEIESLYKQMTGDADAARKALDESVAGLQRLKTAYQDKRENWVDFAWGYVPVPGKKVLTLPILDAFMSPRRPENLWAEGLEQDYNFRKVRRFDRCTTCHGSMQKSLPGEATTPAYVEAQTFDVQLPALTPEELPKEVLDENGDPKSASLIDVLGIRLADEGLLNPNDVTVSLVQPKSAGARAQIVKPNSGPSELPAEAIRATAAQQTGPRLAEAEGFPRLPGLLVGDVIEMINGSEYFESKQAAAALVQMARAGKPITLSIRRGLPNPYTSHPRLDLFVGDSSPHAVGKFACTICHDGQGSATEFTWASHTPNTVLDQEEWTKKHGYFDNHHWIYPMYPERFNESSCLKCHHNVVELEPSEKFPEAPAPKVVHGYHLIRKYGCYGCHEVNGHDGPTRRIGPDMRLEPNYFAIGQELLVERRLPAKLETLTKDRDQLQQSAAAENEQLAELTLQRDDLQKQRDTVATSDDQNKDEMLERLDEQLASLNPRVEELGTKLAPAREQITAANSRAREVSELMELAERVIHRPEDSEVRNDLRKRIDDDSQLPVDQQLLPADVHKLASMLRDVETPGKLRKPGPSLRYMSSKLDSQFTYDWIRNPQNFRPNTRMPRFFGLWDHLENKDAAGSLEMSKQREPIEIMGTVAYLNAFSQNFVPLKKPEGIDEWSADEKLARGKAQFETRGCLACHSHKDFPDIEKYRRPDEIVQGPDLSGIADKFAQSRNPQGRDWLYSWIKEPTKYHPRTVMPNVYLDPIRAADGKTFDPADDIVDYLLSASTTDWEPVKDADKVRDENAVPLSEENLKALRALTLEYLNETFYVDAAEEYYDKGIPPEMRSELKGAEVELIVEPGQTLSDAQRLRYIGKRTINKYGCFGCHDIPGFEDAKPIGTGLADWGRKDPSKLAFEHITHYIEHGHGHAGAGHAGHEGTRNDAGHSTEGLGSGNAASSPLTAHPAERGTPEFAVTSEEVASDVASFEDQQRSEYYTHQLEHGSRIGFLWQKLKEPRSYDYEKTTNKKYNERLRMPQFPFDAEEREAVATFVLGLVAEPPTPKYVYQPNERMRAVLAGREAIDKFNCAGCHILSGDQLKLAFAQDEFSPQTVSDLYPFLRPDFSPKSLAASGQTDRRNLFHATIEGIPTLGKDGWPRVVDLEGVPIEGDEPYNPAEVGYAIDLMKPTLVGGSPYLTGQGPVVALQRQIEKHHPSQGGVLTKYLLPRVTAMESEVNPNASGAEAYSWLPPPLMGEGSKVQPNWLNDFLLEPYAIRPATFLRMPKFNMSKQEAADLVNYFAAQDNAEYPYEASTARDSSQLTEREKQYQQSAGGNGGGETTRFDDAMKIVVDNNYCVKCHAVGDFEPPGSPRAKAPNLADVYRRLRPDYLRDWIANPKMILPYTPMPVNIPYKAGEPNLGGVSQQLYHGTSVEQVDALVDLLMNYDNYTRRQTRIADLVKPAAGSGSQPGDEGAPATGTEENTTSGTSSPPATN
jgi:hypothetical protein